MSTETTTRPRNGTRHGDVSYITLGLPDLARGLAFYGAVLGWQFSPGSSEHGAQVDHIVPMMGLWEGEHPSGGPVHGAVLGYRVDDITSAVDTVRALGGTINDPIESRTRSVPRATTTRASRSISTKCLGLPEVRCRTAGSSATEKSKVTCPT